MAAYTDQLKTAAAGFARETGLTLDDLEFATENPSTAEAIKAVTTDGIESNASFQSSAGITAAKIIRTAHAGCSEKFASLAGS